MSTLEDTDLGLAHARPPEDLEDARVRALVGARLLGRTEHATIDRFRIDRRIGAGAMGVVYSAHDPRLDRSIALKVMSSGVVPDVGARVLAEARAAARIQHPHVVSVFDSGEDHGQVWIAMELIDGCTLRQWWQAEDRSWRLVTQVLLQCAEALAEAHRLELVHRDFKPGNVLVETRRGAEPIARVVDFGVATDLRASRRTETVDGTTPRPRGAGTPAYMAPEQFDGLDVDGRADQFSLCVTLFEALHRRLPFEASSVAERRRLAAEGRVAPFDRALPSWLRRVIARGLAPDPADRFASMDAVIEALRRGLRRRRQGALVGLSLAVAVLGGTTAMTQLSTPDPCAVVAEASTRVWSPERRAEVRAWFGDLDAQHFEHAVDEWTSTWQSMRSETCVAAEHEGRESAEVRGLRDACLDVRMAALDGHLRGLLAREPTPVLAAQATKAVRELPAIDACADATALLRETPVHGDPEHVRAVQEHRDVVARLTGEHQLLPLEEARERTRAAVARARELGHAPLTAHALWLESTSLEEAGQHEPAAEAAREAYYLAIAGRSDRAAGESALQAAFIHVRGTRDLDEADRWLHSADAWIRSLGEPARGRAFWLDYAGMLAAARGELERAAEHHAEALELRRSVPELDGTAYVSLNELAAVEHMRGHADAALARFEQSLDCVERALGPGHPDAARVLNNLGLVAESMGRPADARGYLLRALEIKRATLGARHPAVASSLVNLSNVTWALGEHDQTLRLLEEALAIHEETHGHEHPALLGTLVNLGLTLAELDRHREAEGYLARAVGIGQSTLAPDDPTLLGARVGWAQSKFARSDFEGAKELLEQAQEDVADRALPPSERAELSFELARTLAALGEVSPRVLELASEARAACRPAGAPVRCADVDALIEAQSSDRSAG